LTTPVTESASGWRTGSRAAPARRAADAPGKHRGHAVEGHCRGLVAHLVRGTGRRVLRELPFPFPVNPDLVVAGEHGELHALGIVAYAEDARGTDKKFYRTRAEYHEILRRLVEEPARFAADFTPLVVVYGTAGGWKRELLADLRRHCPPTLFLPDLVGARRADRVVERAYACYRAHGQAGSARARAEVEEEVAGRPLSPSEHALEREIGRALARPLARSAARRTVAGCRRTAAPVPSPFQTRYRQGLSLASLFRDAELLAWRSEARTLDAGATGALRECVCRGLFLDLVRVEERATLLSRALVAQPRRPVVGGDYAPGRPDFSSWEELPAARVVELLGEHRALPRSHPATFRAGALDQVAGSWRAHAALWASRLEPVAAALERRREREVAAALREEPAIAAEPWQPSAGMAAAAGLRGLLVAALATVSRSRKVLSALGARGAPGRGGAARASTLAARLVARPEAEELAALLRDVQRLAAQLLAGDLRGIARSPRPRLLSLDEPCSWVSAWYLAIVTNPSHNPLGGAALRWLRARFPGHRWTGWPERRSAPLRAVAPRHAGRVEWQFIGVQGRRGRQGGEVVCAEVRSVTANHVGDKSKEIFDRNDETRRAVAGVRTVGFLDGDLDPKVLSELAEGRGYDEVRSIRELFAEVGAAQEEGRWDEAW
jgi:hypothetical protein